MLKSFGLLLRAKLAASAYLRDILWQGSGNTLAQALGVLAMPLLTRLYSPADFGALNIFAQIVAALTIVLTLRLEYFIVMPKEDAQARAMLAFLIRFGLASTVLLSALAFYYRQDWAAAIGTERIGAWLPLAPGAAFLISLSFAYQQFAQRQQLYRHSGLAEVLNKSLYVLAALIGGWFFGLPALILATSVGYAAKWLWLRQTLRPWLVGSVPIDSRSTEPAFVGVKPYARLAGSYMLAHGFFAITSTVPVLFIGKHYGSDALGQFSLAMTSLFLPSMLISSAIGQVYFERAAKHHADGQPFFTLWQGTAKNIFLLGIPLYLGTYFLAPWIYPWVFGKAWTTAGAYAQLIAIAAAASFISAPMDKSALIVHAWWYSPVWHGLRAATTVGVVAWAAMQGWGMDVFLPVLVAQMTLMCLLDLVANAGFAHQSPKNQTSI